MTSSGSGFEVGEDYIAARLVLDVDPSGFQGMRGLTDEVDRFRTSMEAAVRSEANFTEYLNQMVEAQNRASEAQRSLSDQLERYIDLAERGARAGETMSKGVSTIGSYHNPFEGMSAGMGGPRSSEEGVYGRLGPDRARQLEDLVNRDPRAYVNSQSARGGLTPGELNEVRLARQSIHDLAEAIADRQRQERRAAFVDGNPDFGGSPHPDGHASGPDVLRWIGNELGANLPGAGALAQRALRYMQDRMSHQAQIFNAGAAGGSGGSGGAGGQLVGGPGSGFFGNHMGMGAMLRGIGGMLPGGPNGILATLGKAFGAAQAVMLGIEGLEKVAGEIQGLRDLGSPTGGGAWQGAANLAESKLRRLMHPGLSEQDSMAIEQLLMQGGFGNNRRLFGAMDEYMVNAREHYGMTPAESFRRGSQVANSPDQSVSAGRVMADQRQLDILKRLAQQPGVRMSQQQLDSVQERALSANLSAGTNFSAAESSATTSAAMFSDNPLLQGIMAMDTNAMSGDMGVVSLLMHYGGVRLGGADPEEIIILLQNQGVWEETVGRTLYNLAVYCTKLARLDPNSNPRTDWNWTLDYRPWKAVIYFQRIGRSLLARMQNTSGASPATDKQVARELFIVIMTSDPTAVARGWLKKSGDDDKDDKKDDKKDKGGEGSDPGGSSSSGGGRSSPPGGSPSGRGGASGPGSHAPPPISPGSGGRSAGGDGGDGGGGFAPGAQPRGSATPSPADGSHTAHVGAIPSAYRTRAGVVASGVLEIKASPQLLRALGLPAVIPLTVNEQEANAGYGQATKNAPPPGDGVPTRGYR